MTYPNKTIQTTVLVPPYATHYRQSPEYGRVEFYKELDNRWLAYNDYEQRWFKVRRNQAQPETLKAIP